MTTTTKVKNFCWSDTGIPVLRGQAGSLIAVLDACLVNGYNQKTLSSIVVSGTVATATCTAHNFREHQCLSITGASGLVFNTEWHIYNVTTDTFQFDVPTSTTSPTGTIVAIVAPMGWTKDLSLTNKAVYKSVGAPVSLIVDDTLHNTARVYSAESYTSDLSSILGMSPLVTTPAYWTKSSQGANTTNSVGKAFDIVGDKEFIWYINAIGSDTSVAENVILTTSRSSNFFGKLIKYQSNDSFPYIITGDVATTTTSSSQSKSFPTCGRATISLTSYSYGWMHRLLGGLKGWPAKADFNAVSIANGTSSGAEYLPAATSILAGAPFNTNDSAVMLGEAIVSDSGPVPTATSRPTYRGYLPGAASLVINSMMYTIYIKGTENPQYVGKNFPQTNFIGSSSFVVDIKGPWR